MFSLQKIKDELFRVADDYVCGKHSGFPTCCNLAYSVGDNISDCGIYYRYRRYLNEAVYKIRKTKFGYIPCLRCALFRKPNKVKSCNCRNNYAIMKIRRVHATRRSGRMLKMSRNLDKINIAMNKIFDFLDFVKEAKEILR